MTSPDELAELVRAYDALESGQEIPLSAATTVAKALATLIERGSHSARPRYLFKRQGAGWLIGSKDAPVYIQSRKQGFQLIRFLIANPNQQIHSLMVAHLGRLDGEQTAMIFTEANAERARKNVRKQIKTALDEIEAECPAIADHLRRHLSTGVYPCYSADPHTRPIWDLGSSSN